MKNLNKILFVFAFMLSLTACQDDDHSLGDINAPQEIDVQHVIQGQDTGENPYGDGSGYVDFTAVSENAISYKYIFSDGSTEVVPSGILRKRFTKPDVNTYTVTVVASGKGGLTTTKTIEVTVFSDFRDPEAVQMLTGGSSKTWYVAADIKGHLGVGPNSANAGENWQPIWYSANPFEKAGGASACFYDTELVFTLEGELVKFKQNNGGSSFYNKAFFPGGPGADDACLPLDTSASKNVLFGPSESILMTTNPEKTRGTTMTFSDGGFMAYFINQPTYEILEISDTQMSVRAIMGGDNALAWYLIFTTTKPVQGGGPGPGEDFTNLVWSDEFEIAGPPDASKWTRETGTGQNGWGNNEAQTYTTNASNCKVENGKLIITAKKETVGTSDYTSARLISRDSYNFKYGKVEFSAKLPVGGGTWPALWMLGSNYSNPATAWPACGEIDIMEHKGNFPNTIHGTLHYPSSPGANTSANNTATKVISNASTEFHKYSMIWTATSIRIFVDDQLYHTVANNSSLPFNANFFLIMNVAMGGNFGGAIDPAFTESSMEVEYVRVYQ